MINEHLFQFIWEHALFQSHELYLKDGSKVNILQRGTRNTNSGPDFLNAKIQIGNTIWAGNVELHIKSSDWYRHGHDDDSSFQNVVLHVVYQDDMREAESSIPLLELQSYLHPSVIERYAALMDARPLIACADSLNRVPELIWTHWQDRMLLEKWEVKFAQWRALLQSHHGDFAQLFYLLLARVMGTKVNADAMFELASCTPLSILARHKNNLAHIESILLGQAGLLPAKPQQPYETELKVHYAFFKQKYNLKPMQGHQWKFMRMRPAAFPTIRIAQLAMIIHKHEHLFSKLIKLTEPEQLSEFFNLGTSEYWEQHYIFQQESTASIKNTGSTLRQLIWINLIAPLSYFYATHYGNAAGMQERAITLLQHCKPERNQIIKVWNEAGIYARDAADTQSLIHLYNNYCQSKNCLQCSIGLFLLKRAPRSS